MEMLISQAQEMISDWRGWSLMKLDVLVWIHPVQNRIHWRSHVNKAMNEEWCLLGCYAAWFL
jgi:hypothetical protein